MTSLYERFERIERIARDIQKAAHEDDVAAYAGQVFDEAREGKKQCLELDLLLGESLDGMEKKP